MRKPLLTLFLSIIYIGVAAGVLYSQTASPEREGRFESPRPVVPVFPGENPVAGRDTLSPSNSQQTIRDLLPIYLMEKNGELIPALNWTPEELDSIMLKADQSQIQAQAPDYVCERLTLTGVQKGENAEMELKMAFTVPEKPLIRIPLQLNGVILLEPPVCQNGEFLAPQPNGNGYVLFLKKPTAAGSLTSAAEKPPVEGSAAPVTEKTPESDAKSQTPPSDSELNSSSGGASAEETETNPDSTLLPGFTHEITLKILVPLQKNQSVYSMNLKLPKTLYSFLSLETPFPSVEMRVSPSSIAQPAESFDEGKKTRLCARSLGPEFQMQWQTRESQRTESRILETFSEIHVDIRSREIFYTTNMQLQFAGKSPEDFILNLPYSAELLPSATNQYSIQPLENIAGESPRTSARIHLTNTYEDSARLTFQARLPLEKTLTSEWFDLMGFEIQNAPRQSGSVGVNVEKDHHALWNPGRHIRRVDDLPESFEGAYQFAFSFSEQPCALFTRIVAGRTRMNVQPQFAVMVNSDELRLDAVWTYNIRGGLATWLDINLNGWQLRSLKDIGPENVFAADSQDDNGRASAHLSQPSMGTVVMKMTLYRKISPTDKEIAFPLPCPVLNSPSEELTVAPGLLYVVSAANVKLIPQPAKLENLVRQVYTSIDPRYTNAGEALCYRLDSPSAKFSADFTVHKQQIDVSVSRSAAISGGECLVKQQFDFSVQYESLTQAVFEGSESLAEMANLKVILNDKPLALRTSASNGKTRITAMMEQPQIGHFTIVVSYTIPYESTEANASIALGLPLAKFVSSTEENGAGNSEKNAAELKNKTAKELAGAIASDNPYHTLLLSLDRVWEIQSVVLPWKITENEAPRPENMSFTDNPSPASSEVADAAVLPADSAQLDYTVLGLVSPDWNEGNIVHFEIHRRQGMVWDTLTVDRAWIQTWLTATRRQDTACFRFVSTQSSVTLCLPSEAETGSLEVALDGELTDRFRSIPNQKTVVQIPADQKPHVLEISYYFNRTNQGFGKERIQLPYIQEAKWTRWLYWSIGFPRNIHLLVPPEQLNAEYSWQRLGPFLRRNSVYTWSQLEEWSGASHLPDPPQGVNVYLFSGFGSINSVEITLMSRTTLVFVSSLIILFPGLILLHFKRLRRSWLLILIAVGLLTASLWEPELALVLLQASSLGVMFLALSFLFRKKNRNVEQPNDSTVSQPNAQGATTAKHVSDKTQR